MRSLTNLEARPPAVAGSFYPDSRDLLERTVLELLDSAVEAFPVSPSPKAVIAPHAGYMYSGATAARALKTLVAGTSRIDRIVILGPAHRVPVKGLGVPSASVFSTPLGDVAVDVELRDELLEVFPQVRIADRSHALEHSLEVELPLLQLLLEPFRLLPLVVGDASSEEVAQVLEHVWGGEETRVVVSSDLSHYLTYEEARRVDHDTASRIVDLDPTLDQSCACGATPINGLLVLAKRKRLKAELLELVSSGDTAGDRSRVVGYGAFGFSPHA